MRFVVSGARLRDTDALKIASETCAGLYSGCCCKTRAETPETCGADIDVPDKTVYPL